MQDHMPAPNLEQFRARIKRLRRYAGEECRLEVGVLDVSLIPDEILCLAARTPAVRPLTRKECRSRFVILPTWELMLNRWNGRRIKMLPGNRAAVCCSMAYDFLIIHGGIPSGTHQEVWRTQIRRILGWYDRVIWTYKEQYCMTIISILSIDPKNTVSILTVFF